MREFIVNFVQEYERILVVRSTSKNRVNRHFYWKNVVLVLIIGMMAVAIIGYLFDLLTSKNYVFYTVNVVVFISLFLFYYSREVYVKNGIDEEYNIWYVVVHDYLVTMDSIVFVLMMLVYTQLLSYFTGVEIFIFTVLFVLYYVFSLVLKKRSANVLYGIFAYIGIAGMMVLLEGTPVFVQYAVSALFILAMCAIKNHSSSMIFKMDSGKLFFIVGAVVFAAVIGLRDTRLSSFMMEGSPGFSFTKIDTIEASYSDVNHDEDYIYAVVTKDFETKYTVFDYDYNIVKEFDYIEDLPSKTNQHFMYYDGSVFSVIDNYQDDTFELYRLNDSLEFELVPNTTPFYQQEVTINNGKTLVYQDENYLLFGTSDGMWSAEDYTMYKYEDEKYIKLFDLEDDVFNQFAHNFEYSNGYLLFHSEIDDELQVYVFTEDGEYVSSYTPYRVKRRGIEASMHYGYSASTGQILQDSFVNPITAEDILVLQDGFYSIDQYYVDNFKLTGTNNSYVIVPLMSVMVFLVLPFWNRKVER